MVEESGGGCDSADLVQAEHHDCTRYRGDRRGAALRGRCICRADHFLCDHRVGEQRMRQLLQAAIPILREAHDPQYRDAEPGELRVRGQLIEQPLSW